MVINGILCVRGCYISSHRVMHERLSIDGACYSVTQFSPQSRLVIIIIKVKLRPAFVGDSPIKWQVCGVSCFVHLVSSETNTEISLSEALIFASPNPQYDDRLFIELRLGAQSVRLLSTLRDPMQLRRHQCGTRERQTFFLAHQKDGIDQPKKVS